MNKENSQGGDMHKDMGLQWWMNKWCKIINMNIKKLDTVSSTFTDNQFANRQTLPIQADFLEYRSNMKQEENCQKKGAIKWMAKDNDCMFPIVVNFQCMLRLRHVSCHLETSQAVGHFFRQRAQHVCRPNMGPKKPRVSPQVQIRSHTTYLDPPLNQNCTVLQRF